MGTRCGEGNGDPLVVGYFYDTHCACFRASLAGEAGDWTLAGRLQIQYFWQKDISAIRLDYSHLTHGLPCGPFCLSADDPLGCCHFRATCCLLSTFAVS